MRARTCLPPVLTAALVLAAGAVAGAATYQFTVPIVATFPSGYSGSHTAQLTCGVGGPNISFNSSSGQIDDGSRRAAAGPPVNVDLHATIAGGGGPSGGPQSYSAQAQFTLITPATEATAFSRYLCVALIGTNGAYTQPPVVTGTLPTVIH